MIDSERPTDPMPPPSEETTDRGGSTHLIDLSSMDREAHEAHHRVLAAKAERVIQALPQLRDDLIRMIDDRFHALLADLGVADSAMVLSQVRANGAAIAGLGARIDSLPCQSGGECTDAAE